MSKPLTTTKPPLFEPPELHINEMALAEQLALPINPQNFTTLLTANYLTALAGRDRKLARQYFDELLVLTLNFQNRLVRIAEVGELLDNLKAQKPFDVAKIEAELERNMNMAVSHQMTLVKTVQLFQKMRSERDPVS